MPGNFLFRIYTSRTYTAVSSGVVSLFTARILVELSLGLNSAVLPNWSLHNTEAESSLCLQLVFCFFFFKQSSSSRDNENQLESQSTVVLA